MGILFDSFKDVDVKPLDEFQYFIYLDIFEIYQEKQLKDIKFRLILLHLRK